MILFSCKLRHENNYNKEVDLSALAKAEQYTINSQIGKSSYIDIPITNKNENILTFLNVNLQNNLDSMEIYRNDCYKISLQKDASCVVIIKYKPVDVQHGMARLSLIYNNKSNEKIQNDIYILYSSIQPELVAENISLSAIPGKQEKGQIKVINKGTDYAKIISSDLTNNPDKMKITSDKCINNKLMPDEYCTIDISYNPNKVESGETDLKITFLDSNLSKFEKELLVFYSSSEPLLFSENHDLNSMFGNEVKKEFIIKNIGKEKAVILNSFLLNNPKSLVILENKCTFGLNLNSGESCSVLFKFKPENIEDSGVSILKIEYFSSNSFKKEKFVQINYSAKFAIIDSIDSATLYGKKGEINKIIKVTNRGNIPVNIDSFQLTNEGDKITINYSESSCNSFELLPYSYCTIKITQIPHVKEIKGSVVNLILNYSDHENSKYSKIFHISRQEERGDLIEPLRFISSITSEVGMSRFINIRLYNKGNKSAKINSINLNGDTRFIKIDRTNFNCEGANLSSLEFCKLELKYKPLISYVGKAFIHINYTDSNNIIYDRNFEILMSATWNKNILIDSEGKTVKFCTKYTFVKADDANDYLKSIFVDKNEFFIITYMGNPSIFEILPLNTSSCSDNLKKYIVRISDAVYLKVQKKDVGIYGDSNQIFLGKSSEFKFEKNYNHVLGYSIFTLSAEKNKKFIRVGCEINEICGLGKHRTFFTFKPVKE